MINNPIVAIYLMTMTWNDLMRDFGCIPYWGVERHRNFIHFSTPQQIALWASPLMSI